ncbi:hypothetical protein CGCSCA1_v006685 [Colletotrichum siamense]|nr:hypothetical protein CGCSCA1_v006685 [Colletotrichum siamense]
MRGATKLVDVVGHCSRIQATQYRTISGHLPGILYWRISMLDEQIDAVESIPE